MNVKCPVCNENLVFQPDIFEPGAIICSCPKCRKCVSDENEFLAYKSYLEWLDEEV